MKDYEALDTVMKEYDFAKKHQNFNSAHEAFAVLLEEVDELWDEVKKRNQSIDLMRAEAAQVAAVALCFLTDCC